MSDHAQGLVLDLMEPIGRGRLHVDEAVSRVVGLLGGSANGAVPSGLPDALATLPAEQATAIAADILARASLPVEGGSREPRHIIQRLLAKANRPDPTNQVRAAFEFVGELHRLRGAELRAALQQRGLSTAPLDEVEGALSLLSAYGPLGGGVEIEVDLSLARGLRYYTGLVFEIYVESDEGPLQVGGGGRYDDLVRALGGREPVPACGFSYGLERIDLARPASQQDVSQSPRVLVAAVSQEDHPAALALAARLREVPGLVVEQDVRLRGPKAALRHADRSGIPAVVLLGQQERETGLAVLRDMRTRRESRVPLDQLPNAVRAVVL
jgi:histidyl-tRNA synthetase